MKKKIFISLLIVSFFNYISCVSSYSSFNEEEISEGKPNHTESIKLILKNGVEYECVPLSENESDNFYYLKVDTAGIYVMGKGQVLNMITNVTLSFNGVIYGDEIDSSEILTSNSSEKYFLWTKNNECIYFNKGHYTVISAKDGSGYFLWKFGEPTLKISFDDVDKIEIKTETDSYLIYIVIGVLAATMIVAAVLANQEFPGGN